MSKLKKTSVVVFTSMLLVPALTMNTESGAISQITNSALPELDIAGLADVPKLSTYVNERVGGRDWGIATNIEINDRVFNRMEHPLYTYGKYGWVFNRENMQPFDEEFLDEFALLLKNIQDYSEERGIGFIYVLNPNKSSVYPQHMPDGYNSSIQFHDVFLPKLDELGVRYVSNVETLENYANSELVFNEQFDSGHWNDVGAFYGTNAMIEALADQGFAVEAQEISDFDMTETTETSLLVSEFEIADEVPVYRYASPDQILDISDEFGDVARSEQHSYFSAHRSLNAPQAPTVLFFHGSYYIRNPEIYHGVFRELYAVHNYQNLMNFPYYVDLFDPDVIMIETAEYATTSSYFSLDAIREANAAFADQ